MNFFLGIRGTDNVLCADYEEGTGQTSPGLNHPVYGVTAIRNNAIWVLVVPATVTACDEAWEIVKGVDFQYNR